MLGLVLASSINGQTVGTVDPTFHPPDTGTIRAIAVQPDHKILIGGQTFEEPGVARLNLDGTRESIETFNPGGVTGWTEHIAVQPDGNILLAGAFAGGGQPSRAITRFLSDGTVESSATFNPGTGPNGSVNGMVVQSDGKILLGGTFTTVDGQPRHLLARLNTDGTLESTATFNPPPFSSNDSVSSIALQPDGKILLGGVFMSEVFFESYRIVRLHIDGALDATLLRDPFEFRNATVRCLAVRADGTIVLGGNFRGPSENFGIAFRAPDGTWKGYGLRLGNSPQQVTCMALQADGRIVAGGDFLIPDRQQGIALVNVDGSAEGFPKFSDNTSTFSGRVDSVALQAGGKILAAGYYLAGPVDRDYLVRFFNAPVTQSLTIPTSSTVRWIRGGSAPEIEQVNFERSTNGGANWSLLGPGARIPGGWDLATGLNLPPDAAIRARGRCASGQFNGSSGMVGQTLNVPDIAVLDSSGVILVDGSSQSTDYGPVVAGASSSTLFTIRNADTGNVNLDNLALTLGAAGNPGDFTIVPPGDTTLTSGEETTFTVSFLPGAAGIRTAKLIISSNDPDENPFEINLTGTQATPSEAWRQLHFGSPYNTGAGADLNDPERDGIVNLLEFAIGSDPLAPTPSIDQLVKNGNSLEFTYTRLKAAAGEVTYVREFNETLAGGWSNFGGSAVTILNDDGIIQRVMQSTPAGTAGKRFVRLRVTRP